MQASSCQIAMPTGGMSKAYLLPTELWDQVFSYLDTRDQLAMSRIDSRCRAIARGHLTLRAPPGLGITPPHHVLRNLSDGRLQAASGRAILAFNWFACAQNPKTIALKYSLSASSSLLESDGTHPFVEAQRQGASAHALAHASDFIFNAPDSAFRYMHHPSFAVCRAEALGRIDFGRGNFNYAWHYLPPYGAEFLELRENLIAPLCMDGDLDQLAAVAPIVSVKNPWWLIAQILYHRPNPKDALSVVMPDYIQQLSIADLGVLVSLLNVAVRSKKPGPAMHCLQEIENSTAENWPIYSPYREQGWPISALLRNRASTTDDICTLLNSWNKPSFWSEMLVHLARPPIDDRYNVAWAARAPTALTHILTHSRDDKLLLRSMAGLSHYTHSLYLGEKDWSPRIGRVVSDVDQWVEFARGNPASLRILQSTGILSAFVASVPVTSMLTKDAFVLFEKHMVYPAPSIQRPHAADGVLYHLFKKCPNRFTNENRTALAAMPLTQADTDKRWIDDQRVVATQAYVEIAHWLIERWDDPDGRLSRWMSARLFERAQTREDALQRLKFLSAAGYPIPILGFGRSVIGFRRSGATKSHLLAAINDFVEGG